MEPVKFTLVVRHRVIGWFEPTSKSRNEQPTRVFATKDLDLTADGRLDYFFNQWVYGTDVPVLTSAIDVIDLGGGKYRIAGTITQTAVPPEFHTRVPIYLDFGNDKVGRLGTIAVTGSATAKLSVEVNLPQRPKRALINAMHDVLSR